MEGLIAVSGFNLNGSGGVNTNNGNFFPYCVNKGKTAAEDGLAGSIP